MSFFIKKEGNKKAIFIFFFWKKDRQAYFTARSEKIFMSAQFLPSILVPLVGLVFPAVAMASLFLYVEKEEIK